MTSDEQIYVTENLKLRVINIDTEPLWSVPKQTVPAALHGHVPRQLWKQGRSCRHVLSLSVPAGCSAFQN